MGNPQGGKLLQYAQQVASSKGKRDGLYFPTKAGKKLSPLGPGVDKAKAEGYSKGDSGYHYRILKGQGPDAQGGAYDYVAQGRIIGGFAMVAGVLRKLRCDALSGEPSGGRVRKGFGPRCGGRRAENPQVQPGQDLETVLGS